MARMTDAERMVDQLLPEGQLTFTAAELASIFKIRKGRFNEWRYLGTGGPSFTKLGKFVRYYREAVITWGSRNSTLIQN